MQCKCVSINIVTLLLAWRDCQNGTLDSINSVHPPLPTHVQTHTYMHTCTGIRTCRDTHTHAHAHTHTHTNTCAQNKHTHSQSPFNVYPMVTQCNHGD